MSGIGRNVANNMLIICSSFLFYVALMTSSIVYAALEHLRPNDNFPSKVDSSMASEARGAIDRIDTISNFLPHPSNFLLDNIVSTAGAAGIVASVNLTRQHDGDIFWTNAISSCNADTCVGLSSGTASWLSKGINKMGGSLTNTNVGSKSQLELLVRQTQQKLRDKSSPYAATANAATASTTTNNANGESCQCRCLPYLNTYREDLGICVDDIHECTLSPFVSGSSSEKIPFVFLPLRGQIIYPSREISFADIRTPVCAVTGAQYLTSNGWSDLRNPIDTDYPFRMFRDEGRTFLQWLGEADLRHKMQGRLIVVHLVCRDMTLSLNATTTNEQLKPPKNVFSPCVAFRVNGSPVKYANNVSEVLFQAEATTTLASTSDGMSIKEYIVIGVCSLILGLIYVSSVFLYLHVRKRKNSRQTHSRNSLDDLNNEINYPKNDQVTFGAPFTRSGSLYSAGSITTSNEPRSRGSLSSLKEEMGIIKNNPLLQHFPQLNDHHSGFTSDISNSNSECEMDNGGNYHDKVKQLQTNALVHPQMGMMLNNGSPKGSQHSANSGTQSHNKKEDDTLDSSSGGQENECLPAENVAIIEEMMTEEKLENLRAMVNGNIRKKLYFNPAYFEPHLLAQPPPAALEFLQKIREVIAIAKYKMATKRFQPSLTLIPEEGTARSNTPSVYGSQLHTSSECQGCVTHRNSGHAKNCGDKRNSIEKWLETVQSTEDSRASESQTRECKSNDKERQSPCSNKTQERYKSSSANMAGVVTGKRITPPKQKPPPPPTQKLCMTGLLRNPQDIHNQMEEKSLYQTDSRAASSIPLKSRHNTNMSLSPQFKLDAYSALTASAHMFGFAETGTEIYNNPKFTLHDSPAASQRSRSSSQRSKSSRKRLDTLDQYAAASTPTSLSSVERQHYNMLRSMEQANEHLDASTLEKIQHEYSATLRSNGSFNLDIPTPDYDSTMEKKIKDIYNNTQSSGPSVPTPDYSSLSRKSLKQFQPDSPIYRRKSPQYLIVDYETDSLERLEATKRKSSQSSSSPSSDVSSQLSPSLSTALPLEEELEISHTVYQGEGYNTKLLASQKKNLGIRTLDSTASKKDMASRIKYDTPFRGSMTIEVEHEPPSDLERSTDSDQYEPDTLDRKPKKQSFCDVNAWPNIETKRPADNLSSPPQSLPDMSKRLAKVDTQNSFRLKPHDTPNSTACGRQRSQESAYESQVELRRPCGNEDLLEEASPKVSNLRDIYQSLLVRQNSDCSCKCGGQATSMFLQEKLEDLNDKGRILTLEAKHSRRQRPSQPPTPPAVVEISNESTNKCTIKISTPKANRVSMPADARPTEYVEPRVHSKPAKEDISNTSPAKSPRHLRSLSTSPPSRIKRSLSQSPQTPPPPPPPTSASTTLNSRTSQASSSTQHQYRAYSHTEEETLSNHSESTEVTGVSGTMTNSEFGGSLDKKLSASKTNKSEKSNEKSNTDSFNLGKECTKLEATEAQQTAKKLKEDDFGAIFNTHINGLRNDYSLNKYLNRRKSQDRNEDQAMEAFTVTAHQLDLQVENNNNLKHAADIDPNKLDVVSLSSRSNRSSSRLSDRTKEMYRNAGVPVGIAYPQRNNANNNNNISSNNTNNNNNTNNLINSVNTVTPNPPANNVQTVYRCEIEPVQLTHGMQIAMGLKDRPKKAKDIKNAWKKFVSMAASKFSPTQSPAPSFDKKSTTLLEVLERDEGISSLIEDHPQVSTPKSSYSAPASQNYYEQRFGPRTQEMDSGYMSADSGEAHKRTFYDRYNFKMMSERDHIIRVSTIEDNSDGDSTLTDRHKGQETSARRASILDTNRFEDFEHINEQQQQQQHQQQQTQHCSNALANSVQILDDVSDNDSDKTLTRSNTQDRSPTQSSSSTTFTSDEDEEEEEEQITISYGSSETDGDTNVDDMWESGAESVETHSVLYKNIRKSLER